jgi:hypothetical protein
MCRKLGLWLALLVAATTAVADTVITAEEVISCSVNSASADSVRLTRRRHSALPTWDVYEVRLSDSSRVAELAVLLPRAKVILDSGQSVQSPGVRTREAMRLRLDRAREARAQGIPWYTDVVETLAVEASPAIMATRCLEMDAVLRHCGRSDDTVATLTREVDREAEGLRGFHPGDATCLSVGCGGLLGGAGGSIIGWSMVPEEEAGGLIPSLEWWNRNHARVLAAGIGAGVGLVAGSLVGLAVSKELRASRIASHRARVNDLVRRVNRAVASVP